MNPYQTLNVRRNATRKTVERAFRRAMREGGHPDNSGDPGSLDVQARFEQLKLARDVLCDPAPWSWDSASSRA